jgi:hypothetical protein
MDGIATLPSTIVGWQFLNEPLWRWFIFLFALGAMGFAWKEILGLMK